MAGLDDLKYVKPGDPLSASQYNILVQVAKGLSTGQGIYIDSTGVHVRKQTTPGVAGVSIAKITTRTLGFPNLHRYTIQDVDTSEEIENVMVLQGPMTADCQPFSLNSYVAYSKVSDTAAQLLYVSFTDKPLAIIITPHMPMMGRCASG